MIIKEKIHKQKVFFKSQQTKNLDYRIQHLKKLKEMIQEKEEEILEALALDLGKSDFEAYSSEVGFVLESIRHSLKNIKKWSKTERKRRPLFMPSSKSKVYYEPYGLVLIIGPFNYPFHLIIEPLIGAIAAGNTAILKPSEKTPHTVAILQEIIAGVFAEEYVSVISGGNEEVNELIHSDVDYIFFTGSNRVGKIIMKAAAENLIPVTLELGGKSPTIVHKDADLEKAAARIIWGKFYNLGQTCIAPDYLYVHEEVKDKFLEKLLKNIKKFYGEFPMESSDYGRMIDEDSFHRVLGLIDKEKLYYGGQNDREKLKIAPTILKDIHWQDAVMQEEIFGPLLPVLTYKDIHSLLSFLKEKADPLAFYLFSEDKNIQEKVIKEIPFGGGCINDTLSHISSPRLAFGGIGNSGIGAYHGKEGFDTFSHKKSIMKKSTLFDIPFIYPPYKGKIRLLRKLMK